MNLINVPPFPNFQCCKIVDVRKLMATSLSKHNIEVEERENLFSGEFEADFCQTFKAARIVVAK